MSVSIKALISSKFASSTANSEYTAPASAHTIIDKFTAVNSDSGAQTVSINLVPRGGVADSSNQLIVALSIAAGAIHDFPELQNQILNGGDFISVIASVASKVVIRASGREVI